MHVECEILKGWKIFAIYTLATAFGFYMHSRTSNAIKREDIEIRSARNVMIMTLMPERDREYLKQLRRNRDEEASLMANVPGWEVSSNIIINHITLLSNHTT